MVKGSDRTPVVPVVAIVTVMPSLNVAVFAPLPFGNRIVKLSGEPVVAPPKVPVPPVLVRVKLVMFARPDPVEVTVTVIVLAAAFPLQALQVTETVGVEIVPGLLNRTAFPLARATAPVDPSIVKLLLDVPAATFPIAGALGISMVVVSACTAEPTASRASVDARKRPADLRVMLPLYARYPAL